MASVRVTVGADGRIMVMVARLVGGVDGETLGDGRGRHVYAMRDGLVSRIDVEEGDAAA